jgi:histidinol dehydrogenase
MSASMNDPLDWSTLDESARKAALTRPVQTVAAETRESVAELLADVGERGDAALLDITLRFDGSRMQRFEASAEEFAVAEAAVGAELRTAMEQAAQRIEAFHRAGIAQPYAVETAPGVVCERIIRPIARVGLYVPAGSAPLPSTALMLGVPARLAGCREVVLCTPPRKDGSADPAVLVAAQLTGVSRVFKLGGAQAIAALAYGTASVPKCDKIFGPGNGYVTEAKRQIAQSGAAAIDMPAGPSEVLVIADAGADAAFVAADLLSQAEHGEDSQVMLVLLTRTLLEPVQREINTQLAALPRKSIAERSLANSRVVTFDDRKQALDFVNTYAPEHLIINLKDSDAVASQVVNAGSVFLGNYSPEAIGDYASGTNHTLPTNGYARAYAGVSLESFMKYITFQKVSEAGIRNLGPVVEQMAEAEQLAGHKNAIRVRLDTLKSST